MSLITIGKGVILRCGKDLVILNFGILLFDIYKIVKIFNTTLVDMRFIQPLDDDLIIKLSEHHKYFVIIEKGIIKGGAGSGVNELFLNKNILIIILNIGLPDMFIPSGNKDEICCEYKLDYYGIKEQILTWLSTLFAY